MIYNPKGLDKYCRRCKHYNEEKNICKAYPNGIPISIEIGKVIHDRPIPAHEEEWIDGVHEYPDDNGIIFEEK